MGRPIHTSLLDLSFPLLALIVFVLGVVTGGFSNVTSGGAGIFTVYFLTNYVGMLIQESTGTVLTASTIIVLIGAISFYRKKKVEIKLAITVGLSGVVGSFLAARWAATIASTTLEHAFGAFTLVLAGYTAYRFTTAWRRKKLDTAGLTAAGPSVSLDGGVGGAVEGISQPIVPSRYAGTTPLAISVQIAKGVLIGMATGLFGVGLAGLSVVLFMLLFKLETEMVLGTSLFASFFRYLGGSIGYLSNGQVNLVYFALLLVGGAIGSVVGARIVLGGGKGSKDMYIKMIVVFMLLFISYEFLIKDYFPIHLHL